MTLKQEVEKMHEVVECAVDGSQVMFVEKSKIKRFQSYMKEKAYSSIPVMSYAGGLVFLITKCLTLPNISLKKFNYQTGTFKKSWEGDNKKFVLTPSNSDIKKVEIEIKGIDMNNIKLLPGNMGDIVRGNAEITIKRYYKFEK